MSDGAKNWNNQTSASAQSVANAMLNYIELMQNHILKEENVLFVLADQRLNAAKQEEITAKFEQIEEAVVGHGIHEQFHVLLAQLQAKYA